jgi:predicted ABC-type ATPase
MNETPRVVVIAGPNGAGKTTLGQRLIPEFFELSDFVNGDNSGELCK